METNRFYLGRQYSEALENFGAVPFHLSLIPKEEYIKKILKEVDGILLPGSDSDVSPLLYGEEPRVRLKKVVPEKDETDLLVLSEAEKLKIPILAICYGAQVLNISRGGTLFQDIEAEFDNPIKHEQGFPLERNSHSINIKENSMLMRLITTKSDEIEIVKVNSHHHQSIKKPGDHLKVTAWTKDSVVECIEDTRADRFVLGVQWHPELSWKTDNLSKNIFKTFVKECAKFARGKSK